MKTFTATAAVLGLLMATACTDRGAQNTQEFAEEQVAPTTSPPEAGDADAEGSSAVDRNLSAAEDSSASAPRRNNTVRKGSAPAASESSRVARAERDDESVAPLRDLDHNRPDAAANAARAAAPRVTWRELSIPAGTALPLELETTLSTETASVETPVRARLRSDVTIDGHTALPEGAILTGTVTDVQRAGRVKGRSRLAFTFNEVRFGNERETLRTNPVAFHGEASKGEDATKIGAGAGVGAIIGGIVGGGSGAAKGAAIGGAAGTGAVLATRGKEVELESGTDITATVAAPTTVRVETRSR